MCRRSCTTPLEAYCKWQKVCLPASECCVCVRLQTVPVQPRVGGGNSSANSSKDVPNYLATDACSSAPAFRSPRSTGSRGAGCTVSDQAARLVLVQLQEDLNMSEQACHCFTTVPSSKKRFWVIGYFWKSLFSILDCLWSYIFLTFISFFWSRVTLCGMAVTKVMHQSNFSVQLPPKFSVFFSMNRTSGKHFWTDKCVSKTAPTRDHNYKTGHEGAHTTKNCIVT